MKHRVDDLAILGGAPAFVEPLHVGRPNIGNREALLARINDMLDRRWFTNDGPYVREFERRLADYVGVKHVVAMANATLALEIVARASGICGEVIVPSFTFVATVHALQWQGLTPVFCDVAPGTHHLDPSAIEPLLTPQTTAIMPVHVWGAPCDVDALQAIAERHDLHLIFDAAHAVGCTFHGKMIGRFGLAAVFSFHATKFLNSFEGGAVLTNDDQLAERARHMRNFGFSGWDQVNHLGINAKMTEVAAAMGLTSLDCIDELIAVNRRNYETYRAGIQDLPGVTLYTYDESERNNFQYVVLEVDAAQAGIDRDLLVQALIAENVFARRYFYPGCHQVEPYRSLYPEAGRRLSETEHLTRRVMCLPTGTAMRMREVEAVCELIRTIQNHAPVLRQRMNS